MLAAPAARLAATIHTLVRTHAAASPPPRALPYLGLEHASGTGLHLLDGLAARGIFRKYELVLDLGAGLGGAARWLAARLGCEVIGTAADHEEAAAGAQLTRRAGLAAQVRLVPAVPSALPFRAERFTHVWIVEALPRVQDADGALAEAYRVVRRGGTLAVQDIVRDQVGTPPAVPGWRFCRLEERLATLARAGFVDLEARDHTADAAERSARVVAAREQLLRQLRTDETLASLAAERESLARALGGGPLRLVQLLARRP
jgi:SAM-dependent methyltransferase